jgi:hypothetical protein
VLQNVLLKKLITVPAYLTYFVKYQFCLYIACTISPIPKSSVYLRGIGLVFYDAIKKLKEIREKVYRNLLLFLRVGRE